MSAETVFETHDVVNQSPVFADIDLWASDQPLREAVRREGAASAEAGLAAFGRRLGSAEILDLGRLANAFPPQLRTHDQKGRRLDLVEFHPAYHDLMRLSTSQGLHASIWEEGRPGGCGHVARAARFYLAAQAESGHLCPLTMTSASVAALGASPDLLAEWLPKIVVRDYDPRLRPASGKRAVQLGMGMTEKQGGTDVRANTTRAEPAGDGLYRIVGHKWFMSAPMCDAFLVLAQTAKGLTCFLMPRFTPDGRPNALRILRLKDKLGNRSNASSEVEFEGALAHPVGEEGRGIATILEMVTLTRLDCALASAGLMRLGLAQAVLHARHRRVFQKNLIDQPLMLQVLADMALEVEGAVALAFRLARAFERRQEDEREADFARLVTPAAKYWICKTAPAFLYEAMECLGGNGYVEDGLIARAYREAPVNAIWEGSGNVMALDLLRALSRRPQALGTVLDLIREAGAGDNRIDAAADALHAAAAGLPDEGQARIVTERLALLAAAALLRAHAPEEVADPFLATRLDGGWRMTYGQLPNNAVSRALLERSFNSQPPAL